MCKKNFYNELDFIKKLQKKLNIIFKIAIFGQFLDQQIKN